MYSIPQDGGRRRCSFSLSEIIRENSQCEIPHSTGFPTAARSERNPSLCTAQGVHVELLSSGTYGMLRCMLTVYYPNGLDISRMTSCGLCHRNYTSDVQTLCEYLTSKRIPSNTLSQTRPKSARQTNLSIHSLSLTSIPCTLYAIVLAQAHEPRSCRGWISASGFALSRIRTEGQCRDSKARHRRSRCLGVV